MTRISYWFLCSLSAVVLLIGFDASRHGGTLTASTPPDGSSGTSSTKSGSTSGDTKNTQNGTQGSTSGDTGRTTSTSTVTGDTISTEWGPVQVQIAVKSGTITDVRVLQYPNGNSTDVEIADYALPILIGETTRQQSAQIDMVSGATFTSEGYVQSLQSALDRAGL